MGGQINPQQFVPFNPQLDKLISPFCRAMKEGFLQMILLSQNVQVQLHLNRPQRTAVQTQINNETMQLELLSRPRSNMNTFQHLQLIEVHQDWHLIVRKY